MGGSISRGVSYVNKYKNLIVNNVTVLYWEARGKIVLSILVPLGNNYIYQLISF